MRNNFTTPTPEVQYLPAIFRKIEAGALRIPAFQRSFIWNEAQVLALLQSIYKGYPIGSLLFWQVDSAQLQVLEGKNSTFPNVEERYPLSFVLDGMQRLSTLYGVFHWPNVETLNALNVVFDLRKEIFSQYKPGLFSEASINLSALFSPKKLLDTQRKLAEMDDGDELIDRSISLHSIFQEYQIPTVTIAGRKVSEVVEIFERINSTGLGLNAVDFMRALTWSTEFDLNKALQSLQEEIAPLGFRFKSETLAKTLSVILGRAPTPEDMLTLRDVSASDLHDAIEKCKVALKNTISFLKTRFLILSSDYVPYEGQTLTLVKLFNANPSPSDEILFVAEKWFWSVSFSEGLRGKPANVVTNSINDAKKLASGDLEALKFRLSLSVDDLCDRRLIVKKALSAAVTSMFAISGARSLIDGNTINPKEYMIGFWSGSFEGLLPLSTIRENVGLHHNTAKLFSNAVLVSGDDRAQWGALTPDKIISQLFDRFGHEEAMKILASQFINADGVQALLDNDVNSFMLIRAYDMLHKAITLSTAEPKQP